jgi:DNA-binding beta-propeller fold protein YncE
MGTIIGRFGLNIGAAALLASLTILTACTSNCENAGVAVNDSGDIVVRVEGGFTSPNSSILRNVTQWPQPPPEEESFALSQGYALTRGGAMYVLENTAQHPNLVYRIDLSSGAAAPIGPRPNAGLQLRGALSGSKETWIAADGRHVYSVDQSDPAVSRGDLLSARTKLSVFIAGPKTQLEAPIGVAVDKAGRLCALDGKSHLLLCYAADHSGNVAPERAINLKRLLGFAEPLSVVFDQADRIVVSGARSTNGFSDSAIAVIDLSGREPRVVRTISGPNTKLLEPDVAVGAAGDILALQQDAPTIPSNSEVLAFSPQQSGDVAPKWIRKPSASVTHPFRIAIDANNGDVAILGSDGTAVFRGTARQAPAQWPAETRLAARGWSVAFGAGSMIVADEFGEIQKYGVARPARSNNAESAPLGLRDPEFIATDQAGNIYAASTDGAITRFPNDAASAMGWKITTFATTYGRNMNAFAADSAGRFYFSSASNDAILAVDADGSQSVLSGERTRLNHPLGLAVNRQGALYVANTDSNEILVFARGSSGNAAPIARIAGPTTQLVEPQALAIDSTGKLYVFDGPQKATGVSIVHHVRVYDAGANGDAAPMRSYDVQTKCWTNAI